MCKDMQPLIPLYVDGELAFAERRDAEKHMAACAACRRAILGHLGFIACLRARLVPPLPSAEQRQRMVRRIDEQLPVPRSWLARLWASTAGLMGSMLRYADRRRDTAWPTDWRR